MGTAVLMDACCKFGIKCYHQVSTDEVYGDLPLDRPDLFFTEETPIHTSSPYSSSKAGADFLVLAYHLLMVYRYLLVVAQITMDRIISLKSSFL